MALFFMVDNDKNTERVTIKFFEELEQLLSQMRKSVERTDADRDSKRKLIEYMMTLVESLHKSDKKMVFWRSIALALMISNAAIGIMIVIIGYATGK